VNLDLGSLVVVVVVDQEFIFVVVILKEWMID
jgi:hypothetical protein